MVNAHCDDHGQPACARESDGGRDDAKQPHDSDFLANFGLGGNGKKDAPAPPDAGKLAAAKKLYEEIERYAAEAVKKGDEEMDKIAKGAMKTIEEDARKKIEVQDRTEHEWYEVVKEVQNQMDADAKKSSERVAENMKQAVESMTASIERFTSIISNAFNKVIAGSITMRQAFVQMGRGILQAMIENVEKSLEAWLAAELVEKNTGRAEREKNCGEQRMGGGREYLRVGVGHPGRRLVARATCRARRCRGRARIRVDISAAGGFDIPSGVNPVVQTHAEEMILPKDLSRGIRGLVATGGGVNVHVHALDAKSFHGYAMQHRDGLADAVRRAVKEGRR